MSGIVGLVGVEKKVLMAALSKRESCMYMCVLMVVVECE